MNKKVLVLAFVLMSLLMAAAGGGIAWWLLKERQPTTGKPEKVEKVEIDKQEYKYVSLDKVIVMLRGKESEPMSHYLAIDLVFKTPIKSEKMTKEHLPLLRSIVVKALSSYTLDKAGQMTVEQFATDINKAFAQNYKSEHAEKPFTEAMIGKLIIE